MALVIMWLPNVFCSSWVVSSTGSKGLKSTFRFVLFFVSVFERELDVKEMLWLLLCVSSLAHLPASVTMWTFGPSSLSSKKMVVGKLAGCIGMVVLGSKLGIAVWPRHLRSTLSRLSVPCPRLHHKSPWSTVIDFLIYPPIFLLWEHSLNLLLGRPMSTARTLASGFVRCGNGYIGLVSTLWQWFIFFCLLPLGSRYLGGFFQQTFSPETGIWSFSIVKNGLILWQTTPFQMFLHMRTYNYCTRQLVLSVFTYNYAD